MICGVLCVGTELLLGQITDTNSVYIGELLADSGISSFEHRRVGDNPDRIAKAVTGILETADALIVTGGLGPTPDDITREVLADIMGVDLVLDGDVLESIKESFSSRNKEMSDNNVRQAMVPIGATLMQNPRGTAPGLICPILINGNLKNVYLTPGVPHEMKYMLHEYVMPDLISGNNEQNAIVTRTIKTWGLPEGTLAQNLEAVVMDGEKGEVKVAFLARGMNGIYVKLSASALTRDRALGKIYPVQIQVESLVGDFIYAYDEQTMESIVIDLLRANNFTLAVAESLTGGLVMSRLVEVAGASDVLTGGVVAYDTRIKREVLGVNAQDIYSQDCAAQMAIGVKEKLGSTIGLSTTGVAGPDPVTSVAGSYPANIHNPGEVFIGVCIGTDVVSQKFHLGGDRQRVREYTAITALNVLRNQLLNMSKQDKTE